MTDPLAVSYDDPAQGPVVIAAVTTQSNNATVTVASGGFPNVFDGAGVVGTGIPPSTTVVSISGNNLVLSNKATANGTVTLTFSPTYLQASADVSDTGTEGTIGDYLPSEQTTSEAYIYPEPLGHEPFPHYVQSRTFRTDGLPGPDNGINYQLSQVFVTY